MSKVLSVLIAGIFAASAGIAAAEDKKAEPAKPTATTTTTAPAKADAKKDAKSHKGTEKNAEKKDKK
jgi:hypothetical protein